MLKLINSKQSVIETTNYDVIICMSAPHEFQVMETWITPYLYFIKNHLHTDTWIDKAHRAKHKLR